VTHEILLCEIQDLLVCSIGRQLGEGLVGFVYAETGRLNIGSRRFNLRYNHYFALINPPCLRRSWNRHRFRQAGPIGAGVRHSSLHSRHLDTKLRRFNFMSAMHEKELAISSSLRHSPWTGGRGADGTGASGSAAEGVAVATGASTVLEVATKDTRVVVTVRVVG
jgi:hypothetical protein